MAIEKTAKELVTLLKKEKRQEKQIEQTREEIREIKDILNGQFDKLGLSSSFS